MSDVKVEGPELRKPHIVGKVEIFMLSDGNVTVSGPIKNPGLMLSVFGSAMLAVANYGTQESEKSNIIVPNMEVS